MLSAENTKELNQKIYKIQKETGVQLAVVLVNKIPKAYNIKTFATQIGKKWHVGTKKRGLVYVAAIEQHQQRLAVAENLRQIITNDKSELILADIKDAYRKKDYNAGLNILVNKIHTTLVPASNVQAEPVAVAETAKANVVRNNQKDGDEKDTLVGACFIFGIVLLVVVLYYRRKLKNQRIAAANYKIAQAQFGSNYNNGGYNNGGYNNGGYSSGTNQPYGNQRMSGGGQRSSSGTRSFLTGAALGAAGGYGARYLQDKMNEQHTTSTDINNGVVTDSFTPSITEDNNSDNWGKWGAGDTDTESGFSDDSSSSGDSGFSDDSSSSDDDGATSSW